MFRFSPKELWPLEDAAVLSKARSKYYFWDTVQVLFNVMLKWCLFYWSLFLHFEFVLIFFCFLFSLLFHETFPPKFCEVICLSYDPLELRPPLIMVLTLFSTLRCGSLALPWHPSSSSEDRWPKHMFSTINQYAVIHTHSFVL